MAFGTNLKTKELRRLAAVSNVDARTCSRFVLGLPVREETQEKIEAALEQLGYQSRPVDGILVRRDEPSASAPPVSDGGSKLAAVTAVDLLRGIRDAVATSEGRVVVREILDEIRRADEEAVERDEIGRYADRLLARARRSDRSRRG